MTTAKEFVERLRPLGRDRAKRVLRAAWEQLTLMERYALAVRWGLAEFPPPCPLCGASRVAPAAPMKKRPRSRSSSKHALRPRCR
jgi:hypothetical protein